MHSWSSSAWRVHRGAVRVDSAVGSESPLRSPTTQHSAQVLGPKVLRITDRGGDSRNAAGWTLLGAGGSERTLWYEVGVRDEEHGLSWHRLCSQSAWLPATASATVTFLSSAFFYWWTPYPLKGIRIYICLLIGRTCCLRQFWNY